MSLDRSLMNLQRILSQAWNQAAGDRREGLSSNEFEYLLCVYIAESGRPEPGSGEHDDSSHLSALAAEMQVQKSSASVMVNKLEKRGLIRRVTCRYDARAQHILLTEQGRELFLRTRESVYSALANSIAERLDPDEYRALERILDKVCADQ
ncbi:MarR family winged helix-turn-helix transcriptional regulator [Microbulbifer marinus]|uniref:Transcriptional regulator, MarR family n=1 Tax=Microbulbifer marinus TaxID=658218 RepID=A0A1H3XB91_9GAMM|nr:MarR family transcriptional regulator [Microbulbifer marinus]SDZ95934.1 transcriptional regulator, MarR family [Microbulbifer marinus]